MSQASNEEELEKRLEKLDELLVDTQEEKSKQFDPPLGSAQARWSIAKYVIWTWMGVVGATTAFLIVGSSYATPETTSNLFELIKIGLLPIVTFVIGHYFGSKSE